MWWRKILMKFPWLIFPIFFFFLEDMVDIPGHVFTRGMIVAVVISVMVVCLVTMGVIYRVDLVLFYRHFMGRDETLTGNECHNAGISYLTVSLRSYELIFTLCWLYCWVNGRYCWDSGEGNGTPLQYSGLGNPMDGGAWWAAVHGVAKSRTRLSDFTVTFHFHALEKEMATHSSVLAWRIPGTGEPGGLPSVGSHRVRHDWSDLAVAAMAVEVFHKKNGWIICCGCCLCHFFLCLLNCCQKLFSSGFMHVCCVLLSVLWRVLALGLCVWMSLLTHHLVPYTKCTLS